MRSEAPERIAMAQLTMAAAGLYQALAAQARAVLMHPPQFGDIDSPIYLVRLAVVAQYSDTGMLLCAR